MSFTPFTYEQHRKFLLDNLRRRLPTADVRPGSFWHLWAQGQARGLSGIVSGLTHAFRQILPDCAVGVDLDHHAAAYDLPREAAGTASGKVQYTVLSSGALPTELTLRDVSGRVYTFDSIADSQLPGTYELSITSAARGSDKNQVAGATLTFYEGEVPVEDGEAIAPEALVLAPGIVGGRDLETDPQLSSRMVKTLGAGALRDGEPDYEAWAMFDSGGRTVGVVPNRARATYTIDGDIYTLDRVFVHQDTEAANRVYVIPLLAAPDVAGPAGLSEAVFAQVDAKLPVTVDLVVPRVRVEPIDLTVYVEPTQDSRWDWEGELQVSNANTSARAIILDLAEGLEAGMRVMINGEQRVIGHVDLDAATITLTEDLSTIPVSSTGSVTKVYPGGPVTERVQAAVANLFDTMGPLHKAFLPSTDERNVLPSVIVDAVMETAGVYDVFVDPSQIEDVLASGLFSHSGFAMGRLACLAGAGAITVAPLASYEAAATA